MGFRPARSSAFSAKPEAIRSRVTATIATAGSHSRNTRTARNCAAPASRALSCPGRARRLPKRIAPADFGRGAHTSPKFAADSPLGKAGFEPPVPLVDQYLKCQAGLTDIAVWARGGSSGNWRKPLVPLSAIRPSLMMVEISLGRWSTVMSASGSPFQITMSASLPVVITPTSPSRPMSQALRLVLATIASIGGKPTSLTNNSASLPCQRPWLKAEALPVSLPLMTDMPWSRALRII